MIARTWQGETTRQDAAKYLHHLQTSVLPELQGIPGFCGAYVLRKRSQKGFVFTIMTLWQSMESVQLFAGQDSARAVLPPQAKALLLRYDEMVSHYEVLSAP